MGFNSAFKGLRILVFVDVTLCCWLSGSHWFEGMCCLCPHETWTFGDEAGRFIYNNYWQCHRTGICFVFIIQLRHSLCCLIDFRFARFIPWLPPRSVLYGSEPCDVPVPDGFVLNFCRLQQLSSQVGAVSSSRASSTVVLKLPLPPLKQRRPTVLKKKK